MGKPNFFADTDVLNCLLGMQYDPKTGPAMDLTVDVPDLPIWFSLKSEASEYRLTLYTQGELYMKDEKEVTEMGHVAVNGQTGQVKLSLPQGIDQKNVAMFYLACRNLSIFAKEKGLAELWADDDPEQCGILLKAKNGSLTWKKVSGMDRPELLVQRLFGGTIKMRPYMEDFWDRSETDMMSLEEKIEKAEGGDKFAMAKLAQAYLDGDDEVEQDPAKAAYWFCKEAELEDSEGAFNLGLLYAKGFGVERDFEKAAEWMEKAVAWGDPDGKGPAALYRGMAENQRKAEAGDAAAMAALAEGYMGMGGSLDQAGAGEDYKLCLQWAKKAVDAGCAAGYWPLALAYEHGRGVQQDDAKAVEFYRKGVEGGNAPCQHSYGCRLMTGEGVKKDVKQALTLFEKAADQGNALANRSLGYMYERGEGVEPDFDKELFYFERACQARPDDAELLRHVGYQYTNLMDFKEKWLYGVEKAAYWLRKAADLGDQVAVTGADMYERILAMYKEGKIPLGASMSDCMEYLSGEQPKQKDKKPSRPAPAKAVDTEQQRRQREQAEKERKEKEAREKAERERKAREEAEAARKKAERDARTIHETVRNARSEADSAESSFDRATAEVERATSGTLDYYSYDFQSRLREIVHMSVEACQTLFNAYQNLVRKVDRTCRPLVNASRKRSEIQEIVDLIQWLNEESKINNNFTGTFNGVDVGELAKNSYSPDSDCVAIQRFWEDTLRKTPKTKEEIEEEKRAKAWAAEEEQREKAQKVARAEAKEKKIQQEKAKLEKEFARKKEAANKKLADAEQREQEARQALAALGFFQFGKKSEQKDRIIAAQKQAAEAKAALDAAEKAFNAAVYELTKPADVFKILQDSMIPGVTYAVRDLMELISSKCDEEVSKDQVKRIMSSFCNSGRVVKTTVKGNDYYTLA